MNEYEDGWLEAAYEAYYEYDAGYEDDRELYEQRCLAEDLEADVDPGHYDDPPEEGDEDYNHPDGDF